jgi:hypothetical protein
VIKTRLINTAAAFVVGLGAVTGTVLTFAAPAGASTAPLAAQTATGGDSHTVGPFSQNPYPETNPFPQLPANPWGH